MIPQIFIKYLSCVKLSDQRRDGQEENVVPDSRVLTVWEESVFSVSKILLKCIFKLMIFSIALTVVILFNKYLLSTNHVSIIVLATQNTVGRMKTPALKKLAVWWRKHKHELRIQQVYKNVIKKINVAWIGFFKFSRDSLCEMMTFKLIPEDEKHQP